MSHPGEYAIAHHNGEAWCPAGEHYVLCNDLLPEGDMCFPCWSDYERRHATQRNAACVMHPELQDTPEPETAF